MGVSSFTPKSSGPIVQAFDQVAKKRITALDAKVNEAFNPNTSPVAFLPWLAFHYGVDVWSTAWGEAQKRAVIRDTYHNFRTRGTRSGLIAALGNLVNEVEIIEWYSEAATAGTFRVNVIGDAAATSASAQATIAEIVANTAPHTRHFSITVETEIDAPFIVAPAMRFAKLLTVDAKMPASWPT